MHRAACVLFIASAYACGTSTIATDAGNDVDGATGDSSQPSDAGGDGGRDLGTDTTKFYGASRCSTANVLLCDGFEAPTLDKTTWTVNGTAPVIDSIHAARGSSALHVMRTGNGPSTIKETKTFPVANNTYFGRAFVWFSELPKTDLDAGDAGFTYAHWTFVAASGTGVSGEIRLSGQMKNSASLFGVGTDNRIDDAGTGDWTTSDNDPTGNPTAVPTGKWICIEWMHAGATNETRFYWDGVEHPSLYTTSSKHGGNANPYILPQFTSVWLGWQEYQATTEPFEMWIDEVAIDTSRIGCVL